MEDRFNYPWECKKGHKWLTTYNRVKNGKWCPYCSKGKTENWCRNILENIFGTKFDTIRPNWLINPKTNKNLELDGYSSELSMAFEYNGEQHYKLNKFNKYDINILKNIQYKDKLKTKICKKENVKLIVIDLFDGPKSKLKNKIINLLKKLNIPIPNKNPPEG